MAFLVVLYPPRPPPLLFYPTFSALCLALEAAGTRIERWKEREGEREKKDVKKRVEVRARTNHSAIESYMRVYRVMIWI